MESGHVRVKSTLQLLSDAFPNIYACGDVVNADNRNPNARAAMCQATVVADNVVLAATGQKPRHTYKPQWVEGGIKLTLGLVRTSFILPLNIQRQAFR